MGCELVLAALPQALLGSLLRVTGMSVMPWEMSWFPSIEASIAFFAFLEFLLLVFVYCLGVTVAKAQVGVRAGADPSPGRRGGASRGAGAAPGSGWRGPAWQGRPIPSRALASLGQEARGGHRSGPAWAVGFCWCRSGCRGRSPLIPCFPCLCRRGGRGSAGAEATRGTPEVSRPWARAGVLQRHPLAPRAHRPIQGCPICSLCLLSLQILSSWSLYSPRGHSKWIHPPWSTIAPCGSPHQERSC